MLKRILLGSDELLESKKKQLMETTRREFKHMREANMGLRRVPNILEEE